jgi:hypothetical protein
MNIDRKNCEYILIVMRQLYIVRNEQHVSFPLYLQRKECFTTVTYIHFMSDPFYNYVHFALLLMC